TAAGTTPSPTPAGPASGCRPRPSGNTRPAAGWTGSLTPGATNCGPAASAWRTTGRASSPAKTPRRTVTAAPPRSVPTRPTVTASTTWPATSGSGAATGTGPIT